MRNPVLIALAALVLVGIPHHAARGEVISASPGGFAIKLSADAAAPKDEVWKALIAPNRWWNGEHTYSGQADNLYIDAQATGCFCEKLPKPADAPEGQRMGSVEHMHVVYADPQRGVLRMVGGLGPLQGEAVDGVLTVTLKPVEGGTRIEWTYVTGGYWQADPEALAPIVDRVLAEQLGRLAGLFPAATAPAAG
jgi:uncharacterized protein YndB with AHSA1/START domain